MSGIFVVLVNGESQIEYDRGKSLPAKQLEFLDKMDSKMAQGIVLSGNTIAAPDMVQRAQFVSMQLIAALIDSNDQLIAATCAYLANRLPDLKQLKVDENYNFDLVFDEEYKNKVQVAFNANDLKSSLVH
ncbi:hypothetical protein MNBD_GAMMA23-291 [hydrothermal vent metagenome]|uniref:Uncharacterized protein n=1 Tax=hydrothermal vent metagenome TaxID=652676 RepID=A0A3B1A249_9ZZZZ